MTKINDMVAGPEMDARVAVEVMGWSGVHDNAGGPPYGPMEGPRYVGDPTGGHGVANRLVPPYSTDISAAWEVVERLYEDKFELAGISRQRRCGYSHGRLGEYRCAIEVPQHIWLKRNGASTESGYAPTAPEAICKAALLAAEKA